MNYSSDLFPLVEAVRRATGRKPALSTVFRWCQRPNRYGVRLRSWVVGGRRLTTPEAVQAYVEATTLAAGPKVTLASTYKASRAHDDAMNELNEMGA